MVNLKRNILYILIIGLILTIPLIIQNRYYLHIINIIGISIILTVGLNVLVGYSGKISIGHAAFYGFGAYASAILTTRFGLSFWLALPVIVLIAALFGYVIGKPILKLEGAYLAIATIGIGEITQLILMNWTNMTGGGAGFKHIPPPAIGSFEIDSEFRYFYLIYVMAIVLFIVTGWIIKSEIGRGWMAIRENDVAAHMMGINIVSEKVKAFIISVVYAAIAGSLFAHLVGYISPGSFSFQESVAFLCMVLAGGMGFMGGPIVGSVVLIYGREMSRTFNEYQLVIYGLLLMVIIIFMPRGIMGLLTGKTRSLIDLWKRGDSLGKD